VLDRLHGENERIGTSTLRDGNSSTILPSCPTRSLDDLDVRFHIPPCILQPYSLAGLGIIGFRKSILKRLLEAENQACVKIRKPVRTFEIRIHSREGRRHRALPWVTHTDVGVRV
jgi:hypothetical protein